MDWKCELWVHPECLKYVRFNERQPIEYHFSYLNVESGFDVKSYFAFIEQMEMIPNIKKDKRNTKKTEQP